MDDLEDKSIDSVVLTTLRNAGLRRERAKGFEPSTTTLARWSVRKSVEWRRSIDILRLPVSCIMLFSHAGKQ
jgi:hypothetical protein